MFTELFQLEQRPLSVFKSSDDSAPTLTADAGSLKTVLKACLHIGYGDKASLEWDMPFESDDLNSAVFRSADPTASHHYIKINNTDINPLISVYQSMSDIDTGTAPIVVDRLFNVRVADWQLIGHSKTFVFIADINFRGHKISYILYFGDVIQQPTSVDKYCVFWTSRHDSNGYYKCGALQAALYHTNGSAGSASNHTRYKGIYHQITHPIVIGANEAHNIAVKAYKFNHHSFVQSDVLYEPPLFTLPDGSWSMLPFMTMSNETNIINLDYIDATTIKLKTGYEPHTRSVNGDCALKIDWWYA